jgi:hypothetical protein
MRMLCELPVKRPRPSRGHDLLSVIADNMATLAAPPTYLKVTRPLCAVRPGRGWDGAPATRHARGRGACPAAGLTAPPPLCSLLAVLRLCGCAAVRLCGCPPVAMAVEVSVGYVRWVGVWARAWEGRAARGAQWDGSGMGGEGIGEGVGWAEREGDGRLWDFRTIRARR